MVGPAGGTVVSALSSRRAWLVYTVSSVDEAPGVTGPVEHGCRFVVVGCTEVSDVVKVGKARDTVIAPQKL